MALEKPRFEDSKSLYIVGLARRYPRDKLSFIPEQWERLRQQMQFITGRLGGKSYGVWYDVLKGGGAPMLYLSGVNVGEFAPINPELSRFAIPAQRYAVFAHAGHVSDIRNTVDAVLSQWLPSSGKQHHRLTEEAPDFLERYGENFDPVTGRGEIEVWLPIKS